MADLAVGMAKSLVVGVLTNTQAAIQEDAKLWKGMKRNLVFITGEFPMMQCFLNVTDRERRLKNPVMKMWVQQIRDLAYDMEDCKEFVVYLDKKNRWWLRLLKPASWLLRPCVDLRGPLPLDEAVDELDHLKARVEDVSSRITRYSLISDSDYATIAQPASRDTGGATAFNRFIGAANTNQEGLGITTLLPEKDQDLRVISIWGTGGGDLRMASITWNAYIDEETCKNFPCRAWVKLTHPLDPHDFLRSLTAQFYAGTSEGGGVQALRKMEEATRGGDPLEEFEQLVMKNRYLVVLEDLSTIAEWAAVRSFLPNTKNGSCIIVFTQQFEVASLSVGHPYQVLRLNQISAEHSVYAFCTKRSLDDGDEGMDGNNGLSMSKYKKDAAERWIDQHPLVGRESEMKDLGRNVIVARARGYQVISMWGLAGVGKSALVKNMFCEKIQVMKGNLFQKYGWVDVLHPFNLRDFSRTLLSNFGSEYLQDSEPSYLYSMGSRNPITECREILKNQKCMVVIDGLQSKKEWDLIKAELLPESNRRNIIIIVTTEEQIATHCHGDKGHLVFNVKGLEDDTAIELFEKVSMIGEVQVPEYATLCGGLPKLIIEVATPLARKIGQRACGLSTFDKLMLELRNEGISSLLDRINSCFRNYPDSLKSCILYLPIFPPKHFIRRKRLVRRWIAEGYSKDNHKESAEMTGEKQFDDLLDLRTIQQPSALRLGDTRCQVNRFFRNYIVSSQMEEENLVFELSGNCALTTQPAGRHLVISESWVRDTIVFDSTDFSQFRSLTVFGRWKSFFISESMKLLRVLDLEDASEVQYSDLKKMVKLLCRLKFLSLRGCHEIRHLPSSVGDLRQLQTLDVRYTSILTLPVTITKLQKLQYIRAETTAQANNSSTTHHLLSQLSNFSGGRHLVGVVVPPGIGKLTALHMLGVVNVNASGNKAVLKELKKLNHLRKLGVFGINKNNSNKFFISIKDCASGITVSATRRQQSRLLGWYTAAFGSLRSLKLYGLGDRLPNWEAQLTMLTKMHLEIAKLTEDHASTQSVDVTPEGRREPTRGVINFLSLLPELCVLRLRVDQLQDNQLDVSVITNGLEEDSFKKLKIFEIACSSRSEVTFGENTMKKLEHLQVNCCSGSLFFGLENLLGLKEVLLTGSSDEALKADLITKLENHPKQKKPVVNLEELTSSS